MFFLLSLQDNEFVVVRASCQEEALSGYGSEWGYYGPFATIAEANAKISELLGHKGVPCIC